MSAKEKAELVMAVRDYECEEKQKWEEGIDYTVSDSDSGNKILLRIITDPKLKSGYVGVKTAESMIETIEDEDYDSGFIISKRFTKAAKRNLREKNIQIASDRLTLSPNPQKLYFAIQECMDDICKAKCGKIPKKEADCKGYCDGHYSCKIRLVNDNATFHFKHMWIDLLKEDLIRLLVTRNSLEN